MSVRYFDQNNGTSRFRLFVADQLIDEWLANDRLPTGKIDAHSSTRRRMSGIALRPADSIRVEAVRDGDEKAALDYVEIIPDDK